MTQQDLTTLPDPSGAHGSIAVLVMKCQQEYEAWAAASDEERRAALGARYRGSLEELWLVLADDLRRATRSWMRSHLAMDTESLALNMFGNIVFNLPKLKIDPLRNVRSLLIVVARRGLIDEYRRTRPNSGRRQSAAEMVPAPGTPDARMWRGEGEHTHQLASLDGRSADIADPESSGIEDRTARHVDQQAVLTVAWDYWMRELSTDDLQIMRLRWRSEPPSSFREIAELLGPGWEEDAIRQRHCRIMSATRRYLRERGLIDDSSAL